MTLNKSIIAIRVKLQNAKLKKSGKNKFANFDYFELSDFLPKLNELMLEEGMNDIIDFDDKFAMLTLIKGEEKQVYRMPYRDFEVPVNKQGQPSMQPIQYLGALNTYYKRYLYLNAFGITDGEVIDSMDNSTIKNQLKVNNDVMVNAYELEQLAVIYQNKPDEFKKFLAKFGKKNPKTLTMLEAEEIIGALGGIKHE